MSGLRVLGHPLHPVTVHLPIGLLLATSALDLALLLGISGAWAAPAKLALAGGLLGALLTVATGFMDFLEVPTQSAAERTAKLHLTAVSIALALYGGSLWWRTAQPDLLGPALLSLPGALALLTGGWLGGQLVYHHGQGVASAPPASSREDTP